MEENYPIEEVNALLMQVKSDIDKKIESVITMSNNSDKPSADDTSMWLKINRVADDQINLP